LVDVTLSDGLEEVGEDAFKYCRSLKGVTFPRTVSQIGKGAFHMCDALKGVVLNDGLERIEGWLFFGCVSLERVSFPSTIRRIGRGAFDDCRSLRDVEFNRGLEVIEDWAFRGCESLINVTLPLTIVKVGAHTFCACGRLEDTEVTLFRECPRCLSARFGSLSPPGRSHVMDRIGEIDGIETRDGEILVSGAQQLIAASRSGAENDAARTDRQRRRSWVKATRESLGRVRDLMDYNELEDATTVVELAFWKMKLEEDQGGAVDREACRIEVPGPAKDAVCGYLGGAICFELPAANLYHERE